MYNFTPIFIENDIRLKCLIIITKVYLFIMKTKAKNVFDKITIKLSINC